MNKLDTTYTDLLTDILDNGIEKGDRTGTGTKSVFGRQIRHNMAEGFPLLTTKKMAFKSILVELIWFLKGDTNIKYLVENGCNIWTGDAYKKYATEMERGKHGAWFDMKEFVNEIKTNDEFAKKWGDLGPIYGKQWRGWGEIGKLRMKDIKGNSYYGEYKQIDQIANAIDQLRNNPDSRRIMVNAWNVGEIENMTLPPCHYGFQLYTKEFTLHERYKLYVNKTSMHASDTESDDEIVVRCNRENIPTRSLSLMWNQRSVDTFLGLPFNIASYGLLLEIFANEVNMVPDELIANLGDTHLYLNHLDQAREQIGSELSDMSLNQIFKEMDAENFDAFVTAKRLKIVALESQDFEAAAMHRDTERKAKTALSQLELPISDRQPYDLPQMKIADKYFEDLTIEDFELIGYKSHSKIEAPLSN